MNVHVPIIANGMATPQFQAQWRQRDPTKLPLPPSLALVNADLTPTGQFIGLYRMAWGEGLPARDPICNGDGTPARGFLIRWP